jgi:hypothetical protein
VQPSSSAECASACFNKYLSAAACSSMNKEILQTSLPDRWGLLLQQRVLRCLFAIIGMQQMHIAALG